MAELGKTEFETKYNDASTGRFKTGQSRGIGSDDFRDMVTDMKDSILFTEDAGAGGSSAWGDITGSLTDQADLYAELILKEPLQRTFHREPASYGLILGDESEGIEMNVAGANTITVPLNATQAFPVGSIIPIVQYGAGLTSIVATGGVIIRYTAGNLDAPAQYVPMFLRKIATDEWYLWNGTAASGGNVDSVNGATGVVVIDAGDIAVTPTGGISSTDVQAAIAELDSEKQASLGFTAENVSNKATDFSTLNNTLYPSVQAVENRVLSAVAGLKWKDAVRVSTTVAGTLASSFENGDTVDGVVLATGNRILIKNQSAQTENGIYTVNASGAPTRATDADANTELEGATVTVLLGTSNANTTWTQITTSISLGSSNIVWNQFGASVPAASETTPGTIEIATQAEVTTGTDDVRAITPLKLATAVTAASETTAGKIEIATQAEVTTGTDDVRAVTPLKLATETRGIQDLFISAAAMWPRSTAGCQALAQSEMTTSLFNIQSLDFDQSSQEFAQFQIVLPRKWNNGTVTAVFYWTASTGSGDVQFGISGGAYSNDDALTVAFGTAQTVDDTLLATNDLHVTSATSAITLAGSPADADFLAFQISRNVASDTLTGDAKLLGVSIRLTNDANKDA